MKRKVSLVHHQIPSEEAEDSTVEVDPEDIDFGGAADGTRARMSDEKSHDPKAKDGSRRHYYDAKTITGGQKRSKVALPIDDKDFMGGKYAGKKVSKYDLGLKDEPKAKDEVDPSDASWTSNRSETEASDHEESWPVSTASKELLKGKLRALKDAEDLQVEMVAKKMVDDVERGRHVRGQLEKWQSALDLRVRLQPLVTLAQRLPSIPVYRALCEDEQVSAGQKASTETLNDLCLGLLKHLHADRLDDVEEALCLHDTVMSSVWKESLDKWHQKVSLISGDALNAKKQMKIINQSVWTLVETAMRDRERLVKRAFTPRTTVRPMVKDEDRVCAFDDGDFFALLVRDWVATEGAAGSGGVGNDVARAAGLVVHKVRQHRAGVDSRASKGRKLRYDVQDKIVGYMVPLRDPLLWPNEKIDAFFESIFQTDEQEANWNAS